MSSTTSKMLLFLDYDGVMHPTTRGSLPFEHLDALQDILRQHPHVQVVISSSWRLVFDLHHMREAYFDEDVQSRIIGVTPLIPGARRWEEIAAYLKQVRYTGPYVVVDDDPSEFPANWEPLLLCAPDVGLATEKQAELVERLRSS